MSKQIAAALLNIRWLKAGDKNYKFEQIEYLLLMFIPLSMNR